MDKINHIKENTKIFNILYQLVNIQHQYLEQTEKKLTDAEKKLAIYREPIEKLFGIGSAEKIESIAEELGISIFNFFDCKFTCKQVSDKCRELKIDISSKEVSKIAEKYNYFDNMFLAQRLERTKYDKTKKHTTTVFFSMLGIYLIITRVKEDKIKAYLKDLAEQDQESIDLLAK